MKTRSIFLHASALALGNIASILLAFGVYSLLRTANSQINQIAVQAPAAALLNILGFLVWVWGSNHIPPFKTLKLRTRLDYLLTYLTALLWGPLLFVPLHFIGRGYLTGIGNILGLWAFQLPANLLAIMAAILAAMKMNSPEEETAIEAS